MDATPLASRRAAVDVLMACLDKGQPLDDALAGHRGFTAVAGGAQDCPYTYMTDLAAGKYRLPWEDSVRFTDGTSCGFPKPTRRFGETLKDAAE